MPPPFTCAVRMLRVCCLSVWLLEHLSKTVDQSDLPLIERIAHVFACLARIRDVISSDRDLVHGVMEPSSRPS